MRVEVTFAGVVGLVLGLSGCTSGGEGEPGASLARTGSFGVMRIERSATAELPELSERRAVLNAVFARYRGLEGQDALALLGVGRPGPEADRCAFVGADEPPVPDADAQVDLVDVGSLEVRVAGSEARLRPRTFPALGSLAAGVFYAEDTELAEARAEVDEYRVVATGSERVAPFEVVAVAPPALSGVTVGGFERGERPKLGRDRPLEVIWDAGDPRDRVALQLTAGSRVLECRARDDGMLRIPADRMAELEADAQARLVLRRLRVQPFDAPGIDVAWADLISTRSLSVTVH